MASSQLLRHADYVAASLKSGQACRVSPVAGRCKRSSHSPTHRQPLQDLFFSEAVSDQHFQGNLLSQSFGSSWDVASHSSVKPSAVEHTAATVPELDVDAVAAAEERQEQKRRAKVRAYVLL